MTPGFPRNDLVHCGVSDSIRFRQSSDRSSARSFATGSLHLADRKFCPTKSARRPSSYGTTNRSPNRAAGYLFDGCRSNPECLRKSSITGAFCIAATDFKDFCAGQLCRIDHCAISVSSPSHFVSGVFCSSTSTKMAWPHAARIITAMKHFHAFRNLPLSQSKGNPMGGLQECCATPWCGNLDVEQTVSYWSTPRSSAPGPDPATVCLSYPSVKVRPIHVFQGDLMVGAHG